MGWKATAPLVSLTLIACGGDLGGGGAGGQAGGGAVAGASTGGTDAGTGAGGVAGSTSLSGSAGAGNAGGGASGGGGAPMEFDVVVGCAEAPKASTFWPWATPMARFDAHSISGDGRVVGGSYNGVYPFLWSPQGYFMELGAPSMDDTPLSDRVLLEEANCDGSVFLARDPWTEEVWRVEPNERTDFLFGGEGEVATPLALSPDGGAVVGNLDRSTGVGPRPTLWTLAGGAEPLEPLRNALALRIGDDAAWLVGEDIRHFFRFEPASSRKTRIGSSGLNPPSTVVSADGSTIAFSTDFGIYISRDGGIVSAACPDRGCYPIDISGTGKLVLAAGGRGGALLVNEHGYRALDELFANAFGEPVWDGLGFTAMSDDGRAFIGVAYGYREGPSKVSDRAFYAVLPPDALD